jgi:hypothetical protein
MFFINIISFQIEHPGELFKKKRIHTNIFS